MPVLAGAEPFVHDGSREVGVLLCHGFTSTPATMRPWGEHLAEAGFTVRCPRLPGPRHQVPLRWRSALLPITHLRSLQHAQTMLSRPH